MFTATVFNDSVAAIVDIRGSNCDRCFSSSRNSSSRAKIRSLLAGVSAEPPREGDDAGFGIGVQGRGVEEVHDEDTGVHRDQGHGEEEELVHAVLHSGGFQEAPAHGSCSRR